MKDYCILLQGLLDGVMIDIIKTYPHLTKSLERDKTRLQASIEARGINVLTIELPALGKHFDSCLSRGRFTPSSLPHGRVVSRRHQYQRLFSGLMKLIFDDLGFERLDADPTAVSFIRQLCYQGKKPTLKCSDSYLYKAVSEFYSNDQDLPTPSNFWRTDRISAHNDHRNISFDEGRGEASLPMDELFNIHPAARSGNVVSPFGTLQLVADRVTSSLGEFIPSEWKLKHGPGAVSERFEQSKFELPTWSARLDSVFCREEFGYANLNFALDARSQQDNSRLLAVESASKLIAVPKSLTTPRLIASEPIANQFAQQSIMAFMRSRIGESLIRKSVTIEDQNPSRDRALLASLTGTSITVDLKSASDRMSCWAVERLMRANWSLLNALKASRTRYLTNDIDKKQPKLIELRKFAAMGSAVTFPVQSILYCCVAISAILHSRGLTVSDSNIRKVSAEVVVYGDDIIAPVDCAETLFSILEGLRLKINYTKTHVSGYFRESCGMDAYKGIDVTPAYVLEPYTESRPSSVSSIVEVANNLFRKGLWNAAKALESTLPWWVLDELPIVASGGGAFGLLSFVGDSFQHLRSRWDDNLHQVVYRSISLSSDIALSKPKGEDALYQWFTDNPGPDVVWKPGVVRDLRMKMRKVWKPAYVLST